MNYSAGRNGVAINVHRKRDMVPTLEGNQKNDRKSIAYNFTKKRISENGKIKVW